MLWRPLLARVKVNHRRLNSRILAKMCAVVLLPWQQGWFKNKALKIFV